MVTVERESENDLMLKLGSHTLQIPVVLAPMAGVTNAPFRSLCRQFGPGLVYVNEMVMATGLVRSSAKSQRLITFSPDEDLRSVQLYGSDPEIMGRAVAQLVANEAVDHIDLNFGCPAAKVTRKGGGAAVPLKKNLLRAIIRAAVSEGKKGGIPVTCKFRMGITDDLLTYLHTAEIAGEEGVAWVALHARTVEQHYAGQARWPAIATLKSHFPDLQVLGNGDIWDAHDAVKMMEQTGCDGVVVGRGCLGRPWLFRDLVDVFSGRDIQPTPLLGEVVDVMLQHARMLDAHATTALPGENIRGAKEFRKHAGWYLTGYPVGGEVRRRASNCSTVQELEELFVDVDRSIAIVEGGERFTRGHTNGPIKVALPPGYLESLDDMVVPDDNNEMQLSGG